MTGTTTWKNLRPRVVTPEDEPHIARGREIIQAELRLAALRKHRKRSQTAVAKTLAISQSRVSAIERGPDPKLSTVAGYVKALGGHLEIAAVFDDERIPIT
jgi:DNA-binding XRE family transcriptional regulator